ncbi:hypothetical protein [Nocardioides marmotae]|uniref:hypothetical protein n=1 Tax=Nocardioides marmotae TaxID=2663857 RepID=UPI0012B595F7|nr:hypothetical protein [Nocardioides marmotae]MBC9733637.1 hypothetical protein [Nocardioides marmotae]MTB84740.1 hypothetical protein [Nocardioides marmotae]
MTGVLALVAVAGIVVLGFVDGFPAPVVAGAVVVGVLAWASMLKPRVLVVGRRLVLRNMLETVSIPLAAVEELAVRQVLAVRVGEKRYVSTAIGRSWRNTLKSNKRPTAGEEDAPTPRKEPAYADVVEDRIRQLADDDRAQRGIARYSPEAEALGAEVRRTPAWLEIGLLAAAVLAFVVTLLV